MLQLLSGNPRTVDALGFLLAFALTALMDSVFHDKLPHDHGRAFAVNGELSKGKARGRPHLCALHCTGHAGRGAF